jgi:multidrug efflux pump subunit AcrA (membrane-fusion protein)
VETKAGTAEVRALVDGRALAVFVETGDEVREGQVLAELEADAAAAEVAQREAEMRALSATAGAIKEGSRPEERAGLEAEVRAARHEWDLARRRAQQDEMIFQSGGISTSAHDASDDLEKVKRALLEEAESRLKLANAGGRAADVAAARERVRAAEAAARRTRRQLEHTRLVAPIDGRVLARRVDVGDTIVAATGMALFEIADVSRSEVRLEVEEPDAPRLSPGLSVEAHLSGQVVGHGKIVRLCPRLERRTIDADDARARADGLVRCAWLEWDVGQSPLLPIGQHLDASIALPPRHAAVLLPRGAVSVHDGMAVVRVPWAFWSAERRVELGAADGKSVEVRGLSAGTRVLLSAR